MTRATRVALAIVMTLAGVLAVTSAPSARADELPAITMVEAPTHHGVRRFGHSLRMDRGAWAPGVDRVRYQWLRDGAPVRTTKKRRYRIAPGDVGHRMSVQVTVSAPGHADATVLVKVGRIKHRIKVRRTVRYSVRVRGEIGAGVGEFRRLAQETYDDPRGWRSRGVRFQQVRRGGAFTLWLSAAHLVPTFSTACSSEWSCRVGRNVVINVQRWRHASPAWNGAGRSVRDYRHMVVNHETGHWLGFGHASCSRRGALAPVMMQQSKGTSGCRFNPWPTMGEIRR